jgi:hypothetical protein
MRKMIWAEMPLCLMTALLSACGGSSTPSATHNVYTPAQISSGGSAYLLRPGLALVRQCA